MSQSHRRKKQPILVRQQLLAVAGRLAVEQGMAAVTLDAVSQAAGVSKGGLLHHFPTKVTLLDGLFDSLVSAFDAAIDREMVNDPVPQGRFTRAYLRAVIGLQAEAEEGGGWRGLTMALLSEPGLRGRWRAWVQERSDEYVGTDSSIDAMIVRFAADGLWFADLVDSHELSADLRNGLVNRLMALAR